MKKRLILITLTIVLILTSVFVYADLDIDAKSSLLMDFGSGEIIYAKNEHEKLAPASITKIMTLLIAMEALEEGKITLADEITISEYASSMGGTQLYLDAGEKQTVDNLIKAIAIRSANDAAVALGEYIGGSNEGFVKLMNERAKSLGMKNTNFENSSGLPKEDHYTTAYDIAIMSRELLRHKDITKYLETYMEDLIVGKRKISTQTMVNTNRLIKEYEGANGIKTGYTTEAQHCISASAKRGDLQLISVIIGAESSKIRFSEAKRLLDYGFANYKSVSIGEKGDFIASLPVQKGKVPSLEIILDRNSNVLLSKGQNSNIEKVIEHPEYVEAPIREGDIIGKLKIISDNKILDTVNLVAKNNIEKANFINIFNKTFKNFLFN